MSDIERLDERLTAVERTVVDGDHELDELADLASLADDVERLDERLDDVEQRLADVESRSQAMEGFVGNIRSVNEDVEQQADAAMATVDRLEQRIQEIETAVAGVSAGGHGAGGGANRQSHTGNAGPGSAEQTVERVVGDQSSQPRDGADGRGASGGRQGRRAGWHRSGGGHGGAAGLQQGNDQLPADAPQSDRQTAEADQQTIDERVGTSESDDESDGGLLTSLRSKLP